MANENPFINESPLGTERSCELVEVIKEMSQAERIQVLSALGLDDSMIYKTVGGELERKMQIFIDAGWTPARFCRAHLLKSGYLEIGPGYRRFLKIRHGGGFLEAFLQEQEFKQNPEEHLRRLFAVDVAETLTPACAPFFNAFSRDTLAAMIDEYYEGKEKTQFISRLKEIGIDVGNATSEA